MKIAVVDGQGGGIGRSLIEKIRAQLKDVYIIALGTNSVATAQMIKGGANDGATGENAIIYNVKNVDIITGGVAIMAANSMHGELSPAIAVAVGSSDACKILLPLNRCNINVALTAADKLSDQLDSAVALMKNYIEQNKK
ncbi:hypothetical protein SDC9_129285 [bioreactor metagenome]|uniref:DUF3842 family protein n=1 Tax=bioreactor metagenome TaxID=1076179 RepID=A0A645CZ29_9ZZZZ